MFDGIWKRKGCVVFLSITPVTPVDAWVVNKLELLNVFIQIGGK